MSKTSQNTLVAFAATLLLSPMAPLRAAEAKPVKPNILVILSDDHGYADVGFQGCKDIPTPNLDRLASEGLRCTSGYVSHPYCSPSRAGLLTGRYQARFRWEHNPPDRPNDHKEGVPVTEKFLPEFLEKAGYATGWIGKWHLGCATEFLPENRGFQETFGFLSGQHHYLDWKPNPKKGGAVGPIMQNGKAVDLKEHLTLAFGHKAAGFIARHRSEPWFLYLAFNAPHSPNEPTPERFARFRNIADPMRRAYAAQVSLLDDAIGEVLAALRKTGQDRRTLVFFFSDNGSPFGDGNGGSKPCGGLNTPLRDGKHSVYEGGVRVPFVVSWPGRLPAGKDYAQPVSSLDVFATALACAGVPMPADRVYDGVDLVPYLSGQKSGTPHNRLFWRLNERHQAAARVDVMKIVRDNKKPDQLFDLSADIGESTNLAKTNVASARELNEALDAWIDQMPKKVKYPGHEHDGEGLERE
jgi:arylsulfatase A-like enzyme